jgi:endonuclease/exonuclease/phosphatase family metal-dependent hydrolase
MRLLYKNPRSSTLTIVLMVAMFGFSACSDSITGGDTNDTRVQESWSDTALSKRGQGTGALTIMTRNIYVGTDVDAIIAGGDINLALQTLIATNFPERAQAFADEIALSNPDVIGLQEVSELFVSTPALPADMDVDYLDILMSVLSANGLDYVVVGEILNTDASIDVPEAAFHAELRDYDVMLARKDVAVSHVETANYIARLIVPGFEIIRGYVAADVVVHGRSYRIVNTHLEPFIPGYPGDQLQVQQAAELLDILSGNSMPTIMMGDMNTMDSAGPIGDTYRMLSSDFVDVWTKKSGHVNDPGETCCEASDLLNSPSTLNRRFDLILFRSDLPNHGNDGLGSVFARVVGNQESDRTIPSGLWPSDHAGVVATIRVPK